MLGDDLLRSQKCFPDYDAHQHLETILGMLLALQRWRNGFEEQVDQAIKNHDDDSYVEGCVEGTYADVAYCHSAVAALAPFFEAMFSHEFMVLGLLYENQTPAMKHRRCRTTSDTLRAPEEFWNPKIHIDRRGMPSENENIQLGSLQILNALEVLPQFPSQLRKVTEALFTYRNFSLHNGYEWPKERRQEFESRIAKEKWGEWFFWARESTSGAPSEPWIAYMTDTFIHECFNVAGQSVVAFESVRAVQFAKLPHAPMPQWLSDFMSTHPGPQAWDLPVFKPVQWPSDRSE